MEGGYGEDASERLGHRISTTGMKAAWALTAAESQYRVAVLVHGNTLSEDNVDNGGSKRVAIITNAKGVHTVKREILYSV